MDQLRLQRIKAGWTDLSLPLMLLVPFGVVTGGFERGPDFYGVRVEGWPIVPYAVCVLAYYFFFEAVSGQTLGKRWFGVRVTARDGSPATLGAIAVRTLMRPVDAFPLFYLTGYLALRAWPDRGQRLGDMAAKTTVRPADTSPAPNAIAPAAALVTGAVVAILSLASAYTLSKPDERRFIARADEICERYDSQIDAQEAQLATATSARQATGPLRVIESLLVASSDELAVLNAPGSLTDEWNRYRQSIGALADTVRRMRQALRRNDLEAYAQLKTAVALQNAAGRDALDGYRFEVCG